MKQLRPVDYVIDIDVPPSGFYADETMDGPSWSTSEMSVTFFGRDGWEWIRHHINRRHLYLDGEQIQIPRGTTNDYYVWRLIDIERLAHSLATTGYLDIEQLYRILSVIRLIAESWGYLPAAPLPLRTEAHDPTRKDIYAVSEAEEITDDLDGAKSAAERSFALGDVEYSIHLTDEHWQDLVAALAPYVKVARRDSGRTDNPAGRADRSKVRAWARKHGYPVGLRGKIPLATMDAYLTRRNR